MSLGIQMHQGTVNSPHQQADFYRLPAASDEANYRLFQFGAGENHVQLLVPPAKRVTVFFGYRGDQSIMQLLLLTDALRRSGAEQIDLLLPYMPGARQDRVCNVGEALSVKVYASLINQQQYASVSIFDPHSDVTAALLDRVQVIDNHSFVAAIAAQLTGDLVLVSPDAGANKKVFGLAKALQGMPVIRADKHRDVVNGHIIATEVFCDDLSGKTCLIVDDICAGGRTFIELAIKLKQKGAQSVILIVSHYEDKASESALREAGIDRLFCTDSLGVPTHISSEFCHCHAVLRFMNH
ncbi:ribose-phosphate diphosphokinase [Shewanella xiamenensis]|uniref:ribose-phosphate diphosphokinase n=1 Tax=Shewanella xiamenensis TaxID=332186 RepID=UPI0024A65E9A|nr:ribose-phosphate diphosphokinase [Shewanella xiamenensis]MDI5837845.1 ribose-phosphate diphosphokinase [Shewanella xiamenensis]MDI5840426.1 ribose-phosphate diphosphokinase [Shewanella xiamenensis]MDI5844341.1 ribose-phosphate diphosphokinase [Shewanella xiamenensis]MDI5848069.1 ribose-phosphate diphosphokinase [Shewanella xiamenensis]MDI5852361.1 ribose-phosphate diphosphokinase [Shewanella xiamenensis]